MPGIIKFASHVTLCCDEPGCNHSEMVKATEAEMKKHVGVLCPKCKKAAMLTVVDFNGWLQAHKAMNELNAMFNKLSPAEQEAYMKNATVVSTTVRSNNGNPQILFPSNTVH